MAPTVVPEMFVCPDCSVLIESGTGENDLAWHDCESVTIQRSTTTEDTTNPTLAARAYVMQLVMQPEALTSAQAQDGLLRMILLGAIESNPLVSHMASAAAALADLKKAEGDDGGSAVDAMRAFFGDAKSG